MLNQRSRRLLPIETAPVADAVLYRRGHQVVRHTSGAWLVYDWRKKPGTYDTQPVLVALCRTEQEADLLARQKNQEVPCDQP